MWLLVAGPANPHTVNDNTSGVVTLLSIMESLPSEFRSEVAFVFFDLEEVGLVGSSSFAATHKAILKDKLLVNFDCVSDGETMLFCLKKKTHPFSSVIERAFISDETVSVEIAKNGFVYPSDQMMMPCGIGVAALKKTKKGILYMDKIHTKNDTVFREENIEFLTKGAVALVSLLGQDEKDTVDQ
jgi:Zn-dependent M28 family amino/carboxypeptidase